MAPDDPILEELNRQWHHWDGLCIQTSMRRWQYKGGLNLLATLAYQIAWNERQQVSQAIRTHQRVHQKDSR